jgi:hypothetical protein
MEQYRDWRHRRYPRESFAVVNMRGPLVLEIPIDGLARRANGARRFHCGTVQLFERKSAIRWLTTKGGGLIVR